MQTIEVLCLCAFNVLSFVIGAKIGQKTTKGEEIKAPKVVTPKKMYEEHLDKKEAEKELKKLDKIMQNLERYDGTEAGQEDID